MDNKHVVIPIEASLSAHDPLGKWSDHKACWKMQYRGSLGESLLHVLIICDTKIHTKLARILLRVFPMQSVDVMEGEEYLGASALHLAIAYSNNSLVADLIEAGADVNQRAIGKILFESMKCQCKCLHGAFLVQEVSFCRVTNKAIAQQKIQITRDSLIWANIHWLGVLVAPMKAFTIYYWIIMPIQMLKIHSAI